MAKAGGAYSVEIKTDPTPVTASVDLVLQGPAEEILDRLDGQLP